MLSLVVWWAVSKRNVPNPIAQWHNLAPTPTHMAISVRPARQFPVNFLKSFGPKKKKKLTTTPIRSPLKKLPKNLKSHHMLKMKISQFSLLCARFSLFCFSVFFACSLDFLICTKSYFDSLPQSALATPPHRIR